MSREANIETVLRYLEAGNNGGDLAVVDETVVAHFTSNWGHSNREDLKRFIAWQRATAPDWRIVVRDVVADGPKVVVHATASGHRTEEAPGLAYPVPRWRSVEWFATFTLADGRITTNHAVMADRTAESPETG